MLTLFAKFSENFGDFKANIILKLVRVWFVDINQWFSTEVTRSVEVTQNPRWGGGREFFKLFSNKIVLLPRYAIAIRHRRRNNVIIVYTKLYTAKILFSYITLNPKIRPLF